MKRTLTAVCCLTLCSAPAFAKAHPAVAAGAMTAQQFVDFAAQTDMVEANLGQQAQNVASSDDVKSYGQMLVTDHTNDYHQLWAAAQKANLNVPTSIDAKHNAMMITPLDKLKGKAFDKTYIADMVKGHTQAVEAYKKEAANGDNADIKAYAQAALPVIEKHLDDAKKLEKKGK